jgi:hypothetical protein
MVGKINRLATSCYCIMLGIKRLDKVPNAAIYEEVRERPLTTATVYYYLNGTVKPCK